MRNMNKMVLDSTLIACCSSLDTVSKSGLIVMFTTGNKKPAEAG